MPRTRSIPIALVVVAGLGLAGCSSSGGSAATTGGATSSATSSASTPVAATSGAAVSSSAATSGAAVASSAATSGGATPNLQGVTLTLWENNNPQPGYEVLIKGFEAATGAKINEVKFPDPFESNLLTKWATGARPDLLIFQSTNTFFPQLNPTKNLTDLTNQPFTAKALFGMNKNANVADGKSYGLALEAPSVFGVWYNKKATAAAGITTVPTNFAAFKQDLVQIKTKTPAVSPLFDVGGDKWPLQVMPFMLWTDALKDGLLAKLNNNTAKFTDPGIVDGLTDYKEMQTQGLFNSNLLTATYAQQEAALLQGKAAYIAQGNWVVADLIKQSSLQNVNDNIGWFPLAVNDATSQWTTPQSLSLPVTGNKTREAAALAFFTYASGPAYQDFVNANDQVPALSGFQTPSDIPVPNVTAYASLDAGIPDQWAADYGDFPTFMSELITNQATPMQVGQDLENAWVKSATTLGVPGF